jgi:hypothetical protein
MQGCHYHSELYYIKNCASGRFWSYIGDGVTGYVVCDRNLHYGAAYCQVRIILMMLSDKLNCYVLSGCLQNALKMEAL